MPLTGPEKETARPIGGRAVAMGRTAHIPFGGYFDTTCDSGMANIVFIRLR